MNNDFYILITNSKTDEKHLLKTQQEAEDFYESAENPSIYTADFEPVLSELELRVLNLIYCNNPMKTISKILDRELGDSVFVSLDKLKKKKLIRLSSDSKLWEITDKGLLVLEEEIQELRK